MESVVQKDEGYFIFKQLRNSPSYLEAKMKDIFAMIRQLGLPTWFMSLSSADTRWPDLLNMLSKLNDDTEYTPMVSQTVLELLQPLTIEMKTLNPPNTKGSVFPIDSATYCVRCSRCHQYLFDKPTTLSVLLQFLPFWILVHNGLDPASFSQTAAYLH